MADWVYTGKFRLHFNRPTEVPRFVSITNHDHSWEVICKTVEVEGVRLESGADMASSEMSPKWWLEGTGTVWVLADGHAVIKAGPKGTPPPKQPDWNSLIRKQEPRPCFDFSGLIGSVNTQPGF